MFMTKQDRCDVHQVFEPLTISGMTLKNRVVMLPMHLGMNLASEQARAFYVERARGGVGAIVTAATDVDRFLPRQDVESHKLTSFLEAIRSLAGAVHQASTDVKIGVQLIQRSSYRPAGDSERAWIAPSAWTEPTPGIHAMPPGTSVRPATISEIRKIVLNYGESSARVRDAGFDFVEIHSCHGSFAGQFFSPHDNHRDDEYGGDLLRRMRFGLECVSAIRDSVGDDFPISFRLSAVDHCEGGLTLAESTRYALELERAGVGLFSVSVGISTQQAHLAHISPNRRQPAGTYVDMADAIKKAVRVPVVAAGRINTPEVAAAILGDQKADLVGLGRQLIADPYWADKVMAGRGAEIVACDSCNRYCWRNSGMVKTPPGYPVCRLNDRAGREWELPATVGEEPRSFTYCNPIA